jgi:hypothetical protein
MEVEDHTGELSSAEWHQDATAGLYAMPHRFGEKVGERLVERDGQADVAVSGERQLRGSSLGIASGMSGLYTPPMPLRGDV